MNHRKASRQAGGSAPRARSYREKHARARLAPTETMTRGITSASDKSANKTPPTTRPRRVRVGRRLTAMRSRRLEFVTDWSPRRKTSLEQAPEAARRGELARG